MHHLAMNLSPAVAPAGLRPGRIWFIVAALIGVGGLLAAASMMLFVPRSGGNLGQRFAPGQPVTVHLSSSDQKMVWVKEAGQSLPHFTCNGVPVEGQTIRQFGNVFVQSEELVLEVDNERWRGLVVVDAEPAGRYAVTCATTRDAPATLSIGDPPRWYDARAMALIGLAASGLAGVSVITAAVLAVVVAVRRVLNRARMAKSGQSGGGGPSKTASAQPTA